MTDGNPSKLSIGEIALRGTIMAIIITVPSIVSFVVVWTILDNLLYAIIVGAVVHFIAMGFSLNLSKKLLVKK
ncbi:MAG: hypothetical protein GKS07_02015 [Nitrosopumilus sp.]|nr:MAG: hypothetical protein GKS07_02015 [Nitrosopumilus sp.]